MRTRGNVTINCMMIGLALLACVRAGGQIVFEQQTKTKLAGRVSVTLADTTLEKALAALSAQTGLMIHAEPYLQNRTLTVQFNDMSALNVLNALAELGGWQWIEIDKGTLRFARKKLRLPAEPVAIPRLMQNALPRDLRDYLDIRTPNEDLTHLVSGATLGGRENDKGQRAFESGKRRLLEAYGRQLFDSIKPDNIGGKPLTYRDLTHTQRESLMGVLLGLTLRDDASELLRYDLWPHVSDPLSTEIVLQGSLLSLQTHIVRSDGSETAAGYAVSVRNLISGNGSLPGGGTFRSQ